MNRMFRSLRLDVLAVDSSLCIVIPPGFLWIPPPLHPNKLHFDNRNQRQHRHVARALRHRRGQLASRLHAVVWGHVLTDHDVDYAVFAELRSVFVCLLLFLSFGTADDFDF